MFFDPTQQELDRAEIVLADALPHELNMLDAATGYMQSDEFGELANSNDATDQLIRNSIIEAFWTHARCVIEFFTRKKNQDFSASSASAKDFAENFSPSDEMKRLWGQGCLSEQINEQISHVGFCRKAEQFEKLGGDKMVRVKAVIDNEVFRFEQSLRTEFRRYWKTRHPMSLAVELLSGNVACATSQMGVWQSPVMSFE